MEGAGNSNTLLHYSEKDRNPLSGVSYYRLKQVDFDGTYKYSDVVSVVNTNTESGDDVYLFPNPSSNQSVYVRLPHALSKGKTQIAFYNLSGTKVWETQITDEGTLVELRYSKLSPGIYMVQISNEYLNEVKKLVVQN